jgi:hypothetical protein
MGTGGKIVDLIGESSGSSGHSASSSNRMVILGGDLEGHFGGHFDLESPGF